MPLPPRTIRRETTREARTRIGKNPIQPLWFWSVRLALDFSPTGFEQDAAFCVELQAAANLLSTRDAAQVPIAGPTPNRYSRWAENYDMVAQHVAIAVEMAFAPALPRPYVSRDTRATGPQAMSSNGLEAVFLENRLTLLRFLAARGAGADAEDLLQELWVKASAVDPGPIGNPTAYLYRMADNLMLDRRREAQRRIRRDHEWNDAASSPLAGASDQPSAERVLIARERLRSVESALDALGDRTAQIFKRHRIEGVSQRDIASEVGISLSAVEKHLQKAYRRLVELREDGDAELPTARRHAIEGIDDVNG